MLQFRCDRTKRRIVVVGHGELSAADVREFVEWQILEGRWEYGVLYDMRAVRRTLDRDERAELVNYIAAVTKKLPPRGPLAILTKDKSMVNVTTDYARIGVDAGLRVVSFADETEANRWLDEHTADPPLRFVGPSE